MFCVIISNLDGDNLYNNCKRLFMWNLARRKQTTQFKSWQDIWTDTSTKKICGWEINIWKDTQYHMSSVKCKLKQQWHTTHYRPITMTRIWSPDNIRCWCRYGVTRTLIHCQWKCKMVQPLWKAVWYFLTKQYFIILYYKTLLYFIIKQDIVLNIY